jgi:DNA processing protein
MTDTEACVALNMVPRLGPVRLRRLLDALGTPQAVLGAGAAELRNVPGVPADTAREIARWRETVDVEAELARAEKAGWRMISFLDEEYPPLLREIHDPPIVLYMMGTLERRDRQAIGVVGTRKPSHYAADCTKKLSYQLAYAGMTVVSGLALGVDTLAHQAALAAKGRTLAVIGSGLGKMYPPENRELAAKIADGGGAVLSEFPILTQADRQTFPMRNRVVSGLSVGTLVVEAGGRSGALITATQAAEQGRTLYAVPGRIDNPGALGSNRLLQQGAKLVLSAEDILEDLQMLLPQAPELPLSALPEGLSEAETAVLRGLEREELIIDQLITKTGLPSHQVSSSLLGLEIRGLVKALPGGRFVRIT